MRRDERGDGPKKPNWDRGDILLAILLAATILLVIKLLAAC